MVNCNYGIDDNTLHADVHAIVYICVCVCRWEQAWCVLSARCLQHFYKNHTDPLPLCVLCMYVVGNTTGAAVVAVAAVITVAAAAEYIYICV